MTMKKDDTPTRTRQEILNWLKHKGPQDAKVLASRLGVSAMAVRQHLYALRDEQLVVEHQLQAGPRGRPAKLWSLTASAQRFFPDAHSELTVDLLSTIQATFGEKGMSRLLA